MTRERGYFSELVCKGIAKYLKEGKKILCIVNKKGFASGLCCTHCGHVPQCKQCSVSIGYHDIEGAKEQRSKEIKAEGLKGGKGDNYQNTNSPTSQFTNSLTGLCHICKSIYDLPTSCTQCHHTDSLKLYGLTIQKTAQRIQQEFGVSPLVIQSETVSSQSKIERLLPELEQAKIVVGTNIATTNGYDLVIILSGDQSLSIPDYSVRQHTFVQQYTTIHSSSAQTILMQSYDTQHDSIRYACKLDRDGFMDKEKEFRQSHYYPPYGELCVIKYKNENETTLHNSIQTLNKELLYLQQTYTYPELSIYSTPPLVYKKFGKFYYHIIIIGPMGQVRPFMDICFSKLQMRKRGFKIDWMADRLA